MSRSVSQVVPRLADGDEAPPASAPAAVAILAAPTRASADRVRPGGRQFLLPLVLAAAAHAAVLYAVAGAPDDSLAGGGGQQLEAISVTLVNTAVLEARETPAALPVAAAAAPIDTEDGSAESKPASQSEEREVPADKQAAAEPAQAAAVVPLPLQERPQEQQKDSTPATAGGVAMRGDEPTAPAAHAAPAAASAGATREYARYVAQALAKSRPKGTGGSGTVRIKLTVAPGGGLASVEITRSSGNLRLDQLAVAAVRSTALPLPPPGMSPSELTYVVPYHFR